MAVNAFVWSRLSYCNSLFRSLSALDLSKLQCVQKVWLESFPTPASTRISFRLGRLSIGCLLNTLLHSRLPYWCTSSYTVVIQNTLHLSLNLDTVFITQAKAKLMVCSLRSHTLPLSLLSILASVLLMMLQRFGKICLKYIRPLLSTHSERSSKLISLHKHIHPCFCFPGFFLWRWPLCLRLMLMFFLLFLFVVPTVCLQMESNAIKILLELEAPIIRHYSISGVLPYTNVICISPSPLKSI